MFFVCCTGFCMFVLSLVKRQYRLQFYMVCINHFYIFTHLVIETISNVKISVLSLFGS